jgi:hypothetical protein
MADDRDTDDLDRVLWGAAQFAPILNRTTRQIHHLLETDRLKGAVQKVGGFYVSTPRKLLKLVGIES